MISDMKAKVDQMPAAIVAEGDQEYVAMSKVSQLFTAGWQQRLLMAGKLWSVTVGTLSATTGVTGVTGGGSGTCADLDQPEIAISVNAGYFLFAVEIKVGLIFDCDADDEYGHILAIADRSAALSASPTGTLETPLNLLDGAGDFPGTVYSAITSDVTDPTVDELLDFEHMAFALATQGVYQRRLKMDYKPEVPSLLAGPCCVYVYWGGTAAATAMSRVVVGAVPTSWFPVS